MNDRAEDDRNSEFPSYLEMLEALQFNPNIVVNDPKLWAIESAEEIRCELV